MIIVVLQMRMRSRLIYSAILLTSAIACDASPASKPLVLILIGAPGSGKNVQSAFLEREFHYPSSRRNQLVKENRQAVASIQTIGVPDHRIRASIAAEWPKDRVFRNPQPAKTDRNRSIPVRQPSCQTDGRPNSNVVIGHARAPECPLLSMGTWP